MRCWAGDESGTCPASSPFARATDIPILAKKYRFIEFFVPGIIAMTVMTSSLSHGQRECGAEAEGHHPGTVPPPRSPVRTGSCRISYTNSFSRSCPPVILLVSYAVFHVSLRIDVWLPLFIMSSTTSPSSGSG